MKKTVYIVARDYLINDKWFSTDLLSIHEFKLDSIKSLTKKAEKFYGKLCKENPGSVSMKVYDNEGLRVNMYCPDETVSYYYFEAEIETPEES